jgi:hypothetical protein
MRKGRDSYCHLCSYRVNCPFMYLEKDFLQNKFVEGMRGQKFTFSDTLVLNILNQT